MINFSSYTSASICVILTRTISKIAPCGHLPLTVFTPAADEGVEGYREDGKCGRSNPLPGGSAAQCNPDSHKPCCSNSAGGSCGVSHSFCSCDNCVDYRNVETWRQEGT